MAYSKTKLIYELLDKLTRLSDVVALGYEETCRRERQSTKLNFIIVESVTHSDTLRVVNEAWGSWDNADLPMTKTFSMDSDHGKRILGSPLGRPVARMILDYDRCFAGKTITKIDSVKVMWEDGEREDARDRMKKEAKQLDGRDLLGEKDHLVFHISDLKDS
ncbi:MAG: hypothetical protein MMC23_002585 [Stictis urceolatum]|nr:hypothetical protein [Stictis urceolata]